MYPWFRLRGPYRDLELCWNCAGTVLELCWNCAGTVLGLCWNCAGTVLELCWNCAGTDVGTYHFVTFG